LNLFEVPNLKFRVGKKAKRHTEPTAHTEAAIKEKLHLLQLCIVYPLQSRLYLMILFFRIDFPDIFFVFDALYDIVDGCHCGKN